MYRLMQPSDKAAVLALWQRERGESEEFAANAVERFAGQQNVYVAEENDAIAAVALAVPVTLQGRQGSYLYGLCGQGSLILAGLLDYLCAQQKLRGAGFTVAVPATPEQAGEVCAAIRATVRKLRKYGAEVIKFCGTGGVLSKTDTVGGQQYSLEEMKALVDEAHAPQPRRLSVGLEQNRLAMLLAVLHRHAGVACFDQDVFVNAVGGVKISEPAADLAVLLAIASSLRNRPLPAKMVVFGEVGLAGEVRPVQRGQERLKEAAKLGFTRAIVPAANQPKGGIEGMEIVAVERLDEAVAACRDA